MPNLSPNPMHPLISSLSPCLPPIFLILYPPLNYPQFSPGYSSTKCKRLCRDNAIDSTPCPIPFTVPFQPHLQCEHTLEHHHNQAKPRATPLPHVEENLGQLITNDTIRNPPSPKNLCSIVTSKSSDLSPCWNLHQTYSHHLSLPSPTCLTRNPVQDWNMSQTTLMVLTQQRAVRATLPLTLLVS